MAYTDRPSLWIRDDQDTRLLCPVQELRIRVSVRGSDNMTEYRFLMTERPVTPYHTHTNVKLQ